MERVLETAAQDRTPPGGDPRIEDDYLTVTMLAAGLAGILDRRARAGRQHGGADGLLPPSWRVGSARLWWRCQQHGVEPPADDLELLALCTRPFAAWPVSLTLSAADMQSCLLTAGELSAFAEQGARLAASDVEAEWIENRVYQALRAAASANGGDDDEAAGQVYAVLRRLLIDQAVLADLEIRKWERQFPRADSSGQTYVHRLISEAYVPRPAAGAQTWLRCPGCGNPLPDRHAACGTRGCRGGSPDTVSVTTLAAIYEQHRATRRFIHDPGLVEARILDGLAARKGLAGRIRITPYPGLDTLDILVEFLVPGRGGPAVAETWGADAKDQGSARLLGRGFSWPDSMPCDRRFLVLPEHRSALPGYAADLTAELGGRVTGVEIEGERRFLSMVADRARRLAQ